MLGIKHNHAFFKNFELIIYLLIMFSLISCQKKDIWTKKADMPTARMGHTTCVVEGKIYAIGGYEKANAPGLNTLILFLSLKKRTRTYSG